MQRQFGRRRDFKVSDFSNRCAPIFCNTCASLQLLFLMELVGDLKFALVMWVGIRIFALWVNMIQNYWTHTRNFGYRRYNDEDDNAMNIGEWLPVTATLALACKIITPLSRSFATQPRTIGIRLWICNCQIMKYFGLVKATTRGADLPNDVPLGALNF